MSFFKFGFFVVVWLVLFGVVCWVCFFVWVFLLVLFLWSICGFMFLLFHMWYSDPKWAWHTMVSKKGKKKEDKEKGSHNVSVSRRVISDPWRNPHGLCSRNEQGLIFSGTKSCWKQKGCKLLKMSTGEGQRCNEVHYW